jgi:uncharacterized protein YyaL (SSP411 family)
MSASDQTVPAPDARPNHLTGSANPYLLEQAHDLVDWYPWGPEALTKARRENKPVFLSIGYATCHFSWKMREESFQDPAIAALLNEAYVAVKVDRFERPDLEHLYLLLVQHMTGRGGWPMNLVLTPDLKPFYAATYLPKEDNGNVPGLTYLLPLLSDFWRDQPAEIAANAEEICQKAADYLRPQAGEALTHQELTRGAERFAWILDNNYGGFGPAPKFPLPHTLLFLLRQARLTEDPETAAPAEKTMTSMVQGGFYDHIGGGFFRYSTDPIWMIPCFEKLLSDNALLIFTYLQAFQDTGKAIYERIARETLAYVLRDLSDPDGGFYGGESDLGHYGYPAGAYYLWNEEDIKAVLGFEAEMVVSAYNIGQAGSFPEIGKTLPNLLYQTVDEEKIAFMGPLRARLLAARQQREAPPREAKILSGANGLMLGALAAAAVILREESYLERARQTAEFIFAHMLDADGCLASAHYQGNSSPTGCAADYAYLIWGLLELHQATLEWRYLEKAVTLQDKMTELFWDEAEGGFCFVSAGAELPDIGLRRAKNFYDADTPADNSVSTLNLLQLYRLTRAQRFKDAFTRELAVFAGEIHNNPTACSFWLYTLGYVFYSGNQCILLGDLEDPELQEMIVSFREFGGEDWLLLLLVTPEEKQAAEKIIAPLADMRLESGVANAYIIDDFGAARQPISDAETFAFALEQRAQFNRVSP